MYPAISFHSCFFRYYSHLKSAAAFAATVAAY